MRRHNKTRALTKKGAKGKKNKKKNIGLVLKYSALSLIVLGFVAVGIIGGYVYGWIKTAEPVPAQFMNIDHVQTSIVYDQDGKTISYLTSSENIDREVVPIKKIPDHVQKAFIAIEDERFYKHNGFDPIAFLRAAYRKVLDPKNREGGSTITMQLVKNLTGKDDYSLKRKVQEQFLAMELETRFEKDQILETYLNLIPMGGNTYGLQVASLKYFGKNVNKLSVAEGACLAAIPKATTYYAPLTDEGKERNLERQKIVLRLMLKNKFIDKETYEKAVNKKIKWAKKSAYIHRTGTQIRPYFVDHAIQAVYNDLLKIGYTEDGANQLVYGGGVKIYTTMNSSVQNAMDKVFNNKTYFPNGAIDGKPVQGAMVIIDPNTGQIKAMYGGQGKKKGNLVLNRATQIERQPGSSIKPIAVFGPAVDQNIITAASVVDDAPMHLNPQSPKSIYPVNASRDFRGLTPIREAIRRSVNVVAAKVYMKMGPNIPLEYLRRAGIDRSQQNVALSLGGMDKGVSPLQMAAAFVPFAHKGIYIEPYAYTKVVDANGKIIIDKTTNPDIKPKLTGVYQEGTASVLTSMMEDVTRAGTAYPYGIIQGGRIASAGKTGTTTGTKDKWFVGYTPYYVGATWYGYDQTASMADQGQAVKIWKAVMDPIHSKLPSKKFDLSPSLVKVKVCTYSGLRPNAYCSSDTRPGGRAPVRTEYFVKGTEPSKSDICDVHVSARVCTSKVDGKYQLAGASCPSKEVVFVKRKENLVRKPGDPYPTDWRYELPRKVHNSTHGKPAPPKTTPEPDPTDEPVVVIPSDMPTLPPDNPGNPTTEPMEDD